MAFTLERVVKKYYESLEEGKVLGRKCPVCGNVEWPPVYVCNACGNFETEWYEMCGRGEIVELYMPTPLSAKVEFKNFEPYAYAWVKCEEGSERNIMVRNITKANEQWVRDHMPYPVHMEIVQLDGFKSCVFAIDPIDENGNPIEVRNETVVNKVAPAEIKAEEVQQEPVAEANPETVATLIKMAAATYKVDASALSAATSFNDDLKAPSIVFVGFVAKIEDEFDVMVSIVEASGTKTIGGLAALIDKLVGEDN